MKEGKRMIGLVLNSIQLVLAVVLVALAIIRIRDKKED